MLMTPEQRNEFELNEAIKASKDFGYDNIKPLPVTGYTDARQRVHEAVDYFRGNSQMQDDPTPNEAQEIIRMFKDYGGGDEARAIIDMSTKYQVLLR
jgi:hypothetical protein